MNKEVRGELSGLRSAEIPSRMEMKPLPVEIGKSLAIPESTVAVECRRGEVNKCNMGDQGGSCLSEHTRL